MENKRLEKFIIHIENCVKYKKVIFGSFIGVLFFIFWLTKYFLNHSVPKEINNEILVPLAISYLSSFIFYLILIYYPQKRRLKIIKNHLKREFDNFKKDLIPLFLRIVQTPDIERSDLIKRLQDIENFENYFEQPNKEPAYAGENDAISQTRWNIIEDSLGEEEYNEYIIYQLKLLRESMLYVLNNIKINDEDAVIRLENLSRNIYRIILNYNGDQSDRISRILLGIFEGKHSGGPEREDIFKTIIEKLDEDFA